VFSEVMAKPSVWQTAAKPKAGVDRNVMDMIDGNGKLIEIY